jgi:hypothetical protein
MAKCKHGTDHISYCLACDADYSHLRSTMEKHAAADNIPVTQGVKHDTEKPDLSLVSSIWITGVARVLTFGKKKYAAHNWRKGIETSRLLAACLRHIFAFLSGEDRDPETGECHLDHASCCLMFARELWETRPDLDDRYKVGTTNAV